MTRVVLDTNLFVSAILSPKGKPASILRMVLDARLDLVLSPAILKEVNLVMNYGKIRRLLSKRSIMPVKIKDTLQKITKTAILVSGEIDVRLIDKDPSDNMLLACAIEGKADYIISGDHHLTDIISLEGISIVTPDHFLKLLEEAQ
jgi:uncharacterized protein